MEGVKGLTIVSGVSALDLPTLVHRIMEILDEILPDAEVGLVTTPMTVELALQHLARYEMSQASSLLGDALKRSPLWLRGYLLLATIYEHTRTPNQAILMLESGINICRASLRSLAMQSCSQPMSGIFSHEVRSRIQRRAVRLSRYEQILRHRLLLVLIRTGHFEEALRCWTELENPHCA